MSTYESFGTSKNKIEKNWNRSEQNTNDLLNVPLTVLNYNSVNFNKKIITIPILDNIVVNGDTSRSTASILLQDFPDEFLSMIEPKIIYSVEDGYATQIINKTLQEAIADGTLKKGDVAIQIQELTYWFNKIDDRNFLLKIFYRCRILQATVSLPAFSSAFVPFTVSMSLMMYNTKIYETMDQQFE